MSQHKEITIPLSLVIAGIVLPSLLPDWKILGTLLPSGQEYKWTIPVIKASVGVIFLLFPYFIYRLFSHKEIHHKQNGEHHSREYIVIKPQNNVFVSHHQTLQNHDSRGETKLFEVGSYKWKATVSGNKVLNIDPMPYCKTHNRRFIDFSGTHCCPICQEPIRGPIHEIMQMLQSNAKSAIEHHVEKYETEET